MVKWCWLFSMTFLSSNTVHPSHTCSAQLSLCLWVGKFEACFSLALGEKKRGHPYSLVFSRRLCARSVPSTAHKEKVGGWGCGWGYYYSRRSSTAQTIRPIIEVNTFISGPLAALVPVNLHVENAWNFLSKWASQSSYVMTYAAGT